MRRSYVQAFLLLAALAAAAAIASATPTSERRVGPYPGLGGCPVFPDPPRSLPATAPSLPNQAAWNQNVSQAPVHPTRRAIIAYINSQGGNFLHPDFGSPRAYGFPYAVVGRNQRGCRSTTRPTAPRATAARSRSRGGRRSRAASAADGDRHVLVVDRARCILYELYRAFFVSSRRRHWNADSGVSWNLRSNGLRRDGYTSADAAGLAVFPGLVRRDEVQRGRIDHAIRVTFESTRDAWIHPASHCAGDTSNANAPPMGLRLRLRSGYGLGRFSGAAKVIARALKRYGFIVADNGSNWFFSGSSDRRWRDENLNQLKRIPGSAFEVVRSAARMHVC